MKHILVIDDDLDTCQLLSRFLTRHHFGVQTAATGRQGLTLLQKTAFDLVITDFRLPDMTGLELLKEAREIRIGLKLIVITGYSDIRMAVEVIKYGAIDYVTKPLYPEELLKLVQESLAHQAPAAVNESSEAASAKKPPTTAISSAETAYLIGRSAAAKEVDSNIRLVAPTPMSVIITGETGTGKEYVAKRIHELSNRGSGPFVALDCGALPKDIAGSEFFGHEKGAFTGAVQSKEGKFKQADGGTIFLDEVGNLGYEIQLKLLRILQERSFTRIGGNKEIHVDVRILAATNENLKLAVAEGRFREDLYYRLNEFSIELAPLRARPEDLADYVERFISQANAQLGRQVAQLSPEVWEKFRLYSWPGNLRELRNVIRRCVLMSVGPQIVLHSLPDEIAYHANSVPGTGVPGSLREVAEEAERERIVKALSDSGNNKSKAARMLNIDRKTLYNKLKIYGI